MYEDRKYNVFGIICLLLCVSVSVYVCDKTKEGCGVFSYDCHFIPLKQQLSGAVSGAGLTSSRPRQSSRCLHLSHAFYYIGARI